MRFLGIGDYSVILANFAILIGIGSYFRKKAAAMSREHKYDLISLPFAFFWQLTMLMLPLFLIVKQFRASAVAASILAVSLTGLYFFWYKKLPPG